MKEKLNIAICEDTIEEEEKLTAILDESSISNNYTVFQSGEELLQNYETGKFDLLLMDIYMGGLTGIETVTKIRTIDENVPVAFITTSTDFALESYRLSALKYIEKPYNKSEIDSTLKLAELEKANAPGLIIHKNGKQLKFNFSNIIYLETSARHLNIHFKNSEVIQFNEKLSTLLPQLETESFVSPHKSYAVNLSHVDYIDQDIKSFVMDNGDIIPIKRELLTKAKKALENYLFTKTRGIE